MRITENSVDERIEKFNSWKDKLPNYISRGKELNKNDNITIVKGTYEDDGTYHKQTMFTHNLVTSDGDIYYAKKITLKKSDGTAYADTDFSTDKILFHHDGSTSVDSSTVHGCMVLGSATVTPHQGDTYGASGSSGTTFSSGAYDNGHGSINTTKALRSNYPRFNDGDADNTGGANDQVTWSYNWATGDFDTTGATDLKGGVIVDRNKAATPASTAKLLCHFNFASAFEKTGNDTLKVFVNHTFEGA
jgi:hypothetical protein